LAKRRTVLIFNLVFSIFFLVNAAAILAGYNLYPRHWLVLLMSATLGNLLWLLIPLILRGHTSPFFRWAKALLTPLFVFWTFLSLLATLVLLVLAVLWFLIFHWGGLPFWSFAEIPFNLFLGAIAFIVVTGFFQNLFLVRMERVRVPVQGLSEEFKGFKIGMVSDTHVGLFTRLSRLRHFSRLIAKENPGLFAVCGDITDDDPYFIPKFLQGLDPLPESLPQYGILGNHDIYANPSKTLEAMKKGRMRMLLNEGVLIQKGKAGLWFAGVGDPGGRRMNMPGEFSPDYDKALRNKPAGVPTVLLAHNPQNFPESVQRGVELTLSGHTHGGQLGFKALKWSLARLFLKFDMGLFREGKSRLYVSTGTGYWGLPVRFGLSPELSLIELVPAD
jgi:predicted MPP superfamily phosphohydrolase